MSEVFSVNIKKYPKKIVWLDTNFVINMAKGSNKQTKERMERLADFLKEKEEDFFVTEGDDTELRLGNGETKEYSRLLSSLSHGVSFLPYEIIEQFQFQASVEAKKAGRYSLELDAGRYLNTDPVRALERAKQYGFTVGVNYRSQQLETMAEATRDDIYHELLAKRPKKISIADQQKSEALAPAKICKALIAAIVSTTIGCPQLSRDQILAKVKHQYSLDIEFFSKLTQWWNYSGGKIGDTEALLLFLESEEFTGMPFNYLSSILWGDIYAGTQKLSRGDYWDVKHMSAILPFCSIVFTDKLAERRLKLYRFDEKYQTEVYSMSTIDEFFKKYDK